MISNTLNCQLYNEIVFANSNKLIIILCLHEKILELFNLNGIAEKDHFRDYTKENIFDRSNHIYPCIYKLLF